MTSHPMGSWMPEFTMLCRNMFSAEDCEEKDVFTHLKYSEVNSSYPRHFRLKQVLSNNPSYVISNQVEIENVDYVTYIFGASGTWFGFCFLMINPVILIDLFSKKNTANEEKIPAVDNETKLDKMEKAIKQHVIKIASLEYRLNQITERMQKEQKKKRASSSFVRRVSGFRL